MSSTTTPKVIAIILLLIAISAFTGMANDRFFAPANLENLLQRTSLFGLLGIGAAFVIITGGIDLSIGSVVGLSATALPWMLTEVGLPIPVALLIVLAGSALIGLIHGLLITRFSLQPFVVTLCGLLIYRGLGRQLVLDQTQSFGQEFDGLRTLSIGRPFAIAGVQISTPSLILLGVALLSGLVLSRTVYGRALFALGRNPEAARFAGLPVKRLTAAAYVGCSTLAGLGGVLFALDINSIQPVSMGSFYELYAIAAAVLGGCSLRGGEGSILGVVVGAAVMRVLYNSIVLLGIPSQLEFAIVGGVLLIGALFDEAFRRFVDARRLSRSRRAAPPAPSAP
ncbi:Ribose transport system permease protein RbsC [Planctomycetes bacterium Poly30]|uniref:Ribose transport system permease protein RbsC n=1 Tax=Saltatorellus ferox TaxID=2528018 RepID=A0A518ESK1_9BACT|nr:Ribose transport system permease protein RbsC [Planctomycetes bacterium Poly30]